MVGLLSHPVCCLAWAFPHWWVGSDFSQRLASRGVHADDCFLGPLPPVSYSWLLLFPGDSPRPACRTGPDSYRFPAFLGTWCTWNLVCTLQEWSLFPLDLPLSRTDLQHKCSGGSSWHCQTPRLGNLLRGLECFLLWGNFCRIVIFQSVGHPSGG